MTRTIDQKSIRFRTWAAMMLFSAILLAVLWLMQIAFINVFYKAIKIRGIYKAANVVGALYDKVEGQALTARLQEIANDSDLFINITDSNGTSLYAIDAVGRDYRTPIENLGDSQRRTERSPAFRDAFSMVAERIINQPNGQLMQEYSDKQGRQMLLYGRILHTADNRSNLLMMSAPLQPLTDTVRILRQQYLFVMLLIVLLSAAFSTVIAVHISRPLTRMTKKAKLLASGNYDVTFDRGGYTEVNQLSDTLNYATNGLRQVEKLRNDLIANVSHDLRTPLTMIKVYAEMIRDLDGDDRQKREQNVGVIVEECDRLTNLVQDLLDLSKMQAGVATYHPKKFDLAQTAGGIVARIGALLKAEGYAIEFPAAKPVCVVGEEGKIEQVLYNLLINAVNHTGEDKRVRVAIADRGEYARVLVSDSGQGIDGNDIDHIWKRYYRGQDVRQLEPRGTGLGLAIVKSIMELHGMQCGVDSIPDVGSTFWFELKKCE